MFCTFNILDVDIDLTKVAVYKLINVNLNSLNIYPWDSMFQVDIYTLTADVLRG